MSKTATSTCLSEIKKQADNFRLSSNYEESTKLYKLGADLNDSECQYRFGQCLDYLGNCEDAVRAYKQASDQGNEDAHLKLANALTTGKWIEQDLVKARNLYSRCSLPEAQYNLGKCFEIGIGGKKNLKQAFELYTKAALEGSTESQFAVGRCLALGRGVKKDLEKAVVFYTTASNDGYCKHAQFALAECYRLGKGIKKNLEEARNLYKQSAGQGYPQAIEKLKKMKRM